MDLYFNFIPFMSSFVYDFRLILIAQLVAAVILGEVGTFNYFYYALGLIL